MTFVVRDPSPAGNVVSCAWSGDRLALLMRSGFAGPLRGFVLDANREHAVVCSLDLSHHRPTRGEVSRIDFAPGKKPVVVVSDGKQATAFDARTGARTATRKLVGPDERAIPLGCLPRGRVLVGWCGRDGDDWRGELRAISLENGESKTVLPGFFGGPGQAIAIPLVGGDLLVLDDENRRLGPSGKVKWRRPSPGDRCAVRAGTVDRTEAFVLYVDQAGDVHVLETKGGTTAVSLSADVPRSVGMTAAGEVWLLEADGKLKVYGVATRKLRRSVKIGVPTLGMVMAPDDRRGLVIVDRMESRTEARIVELSSGKAEWATGTSAGLTSAALTPAALFLAGERGVIRIERATSQLDVVHPRPASALVAAPTGDVAFVSNGAVYFVAEAKKGKPRSMGKVSGDAILEIAEDGRQLAFADERAVTVVDTRTGKPTLSHTQTALEAHTVDPPDDLRFDEKGSCVVVVGDGKAYRLTRAGAAPINKKLTPPPRIERAEVGPDEVVRIRDGGRIVRVHLAANGKSALVEDGESLDFIGPAGQAAACREIVEGGVTADRKRLAALRRKGMLGAIGAK
jgi:hypothetical protein